MMRKECVYRKKVIIIYLAKQHAKYMEEKMILDCLTEKVLEKFSKLNLWWKNWSENLIMKRTGKWKIIFLNQFEVKEIKFEINFNSFFQFPY